MIDELIANEDLEMSTKEIKNTRKSTKKDKDKIELENIRKKVNYYLITSLVTNEKYKESFDLQLDQNPNYTIKELKNTISPEEIIKFCSR